MRRRTFIKKATAAIAIAGWVLPGAALAAYPEQPITLVAPYGPGGASDLASRTLASAAPDDIGQPVVVVNKTGAGGVTGSAFVKNAAPDGYTLLTARVGSQAVGPALNETIPYSWDDFTILGITELNPFVFVVRADSDFQTLEDLITGLKERPGELSYSTSGPGTILNMGPQMLMDLTGVPPDSAIMLPYKGGGAARTAVLNGDADFLGINLAPVLGQIQGGQLRALAVTTPERFNAIPDVPTVSELGYPELEAIVGWSGLYGPPGLPDDVVQAWADALQQVEKDKTWLALTEKLGSVPHVLSPEASRAFVKEQYETYRALGEKLDLIVR